MNVVICGFPRSGTTLLHHMLDVCLGFQSFDHELAATDALLKYPDTLTKRPHDIMRVADIKAQLPEARFVFTVRDPDMVLTSRHSAAGGGYVIGWDALHSGAQPGLKTAFDCIMAYKGREDAILMRYEDLIDDTRGADARLRDFGLPLKKSLLEWKDAVPKYEGYPYITGRVPGLRGAWELRRRKEVAPQDRGRLRKQYEECPEIGEWRRKLGYA